MRDVLGKTSCPKCRGNVFFEREATYNFVRQQHEYVGWCLQCGFNVYLPAENSEKGNLTTTASGA